MYDRCTVNELWIKLQGDTVVSTDFTTMHKNLIGFVKCVIFIILFYLFMIFFIYFLCFVYLFILQRDIVFQPQFCFAPDCF